MAVYIIYRSMAVAADIGMMCENLITHRKAIGGQPGDHAIVVDEAAGNTEPDMAIPRLQRIVG